LQALSEYRKNLQNDDEDVDDYDKGSKRIRTDEEARRIADTPVLTGDPELDAIELAETAYDRPLLSEE
jgi:hypothetical protein